MYVLTRYVVWEVLKYFLATLVAITLVVTPVMGVSEGLKHGFPPMVILSIMPYMLPEMLGITIPVAMLFAVCSVFGRMTGSNEVVALKSLGISPMAMVWPALVLAAFLSLATVWMYEIAATWCKPSVLRVGAESIEQIIYGMLQKSRSFDCDQFFIAVKRVENPAKPGEKPRLIQPTITIKGDQKVTISADEARLDTDLQAYVVHAKCFRGNVDVEGKIKYSFPGWEQQSLQIPPPAPPRYHRDWIAMRAIPDLIAELQAQGDAIRATLRPLEKFREACKQLGVPESPDDAAKIAAKIDEIAENRFLIDRLRTEPYRRWANGFTCLCFALIGIPVAMLWRHADALTNFFVCFLPILAIYYPLLMFADGQTTSGRLWPIAFWMANAVLVVPAIALLRWIVRH